MYCILLLGRLTELTDSGVVCARNNIDAAITSPYSVRCLLQLENNLLTNSQQVLLVYINLAKGTKRRMLLTQQTHTYIHKKQMWWHMVRISSYQHITYYNILAQTTAYYTHAIIRTHMHTCACAY